LEASLGYTVRTVSRGQEENGREGKRREEEKKATGQEGLRKKGLSNYLPRVGFKP
jgi:hypothetical protein